MRYFDNNNHLTATRDLNDELVKLFPEVKNFNIKNVDKSQWVSNMEIVKKVAATSPIIIIESSVY